MYSRDVGRSLSRRYPAQRQLGEPGRHARAGMHHIRFETVQQRPQRPHLQQGGQRFAMHGQCDMLAAFGLQCVDQATTARDDDGAVAG